jgi:hypothetical protein
MRINIKFNYQRINAAQNGADTSAKFRRNDGKTNLSARHDLESRSVPAFSPKTLTKITGLKRNTTGH